MGPVTFMRSRYQAEMLVRWRLSEPLYQMITFDLFLWQPEASGESNSSPDHKLKEHSAVPARAITKSIGGIDSYWASYSAVCRMLYDYSMQVIWNAVFYDTIADFASSWRSQRIWSGGASIIPLSSKRKDKHVESYITSPSFFPEESPEKNRAASLNLTSDAMNDILKSVEKELFMSAEASLAEYLKSFMGEEVCKLVKLPKSGPSSEVN